MRNQVLAFVILALPSLAMADPQSELAAFSVFPQTDVSALLKSETKAVRGPAMSSPRDLSAQSCYVVPGPPAKVLAALRDADPGSHDSKIFLHGDLPPAPTAASFEKLRSIQASGAVQSLINDTGKGSNTLQISREEAKTLPADAPDAGSKIPEPVSAFWIGVLSERAQAFAAGGAARQPPYDFASAGGKPGEAFAELMSQQAPIKRQFSALLNGAGILGGKPSLKTDGYFELVRVEDDGVLTLGSFASRPTPGGGFQAADVLYYASGGYDVAMTLYQMWPIEAEGKPATLIWRGDLISSATLTTLHGIEKLGSESAMLKDVSKSVTAFKRDIAGAH